MWRFSVRTTVLFIVVIAGLLAAPTLAEAFYWPPWPGADGGPPTSGPGLPPTTDGNPPITVPPVIVGSGPEPNPPLVPEPTTLISAAIGIGLTFSYRKWKAKSLQA